MGHHTHIYECKRLLFNAFSKESTKKPSYLIKLRYKYTYFF